MKSISITKLKESPASENIKYLFTSIFSFLASNVKILNVLSPFGVAITAAFPIKLSVSSFLGALIGYSLLGDFVENFPYIVSLFIILGIKSAISEIPKIRSHPFFLSVISAITLFTCLFIKNVILNKGVIDLIFCFFEGVLGGTLTYFSFFAHKSLSASKKFGENGLIEKTSLILIILIGLLGCCRINFFVFNLGRILVTLLLLATAKCKGTSSSAVLGLLFSAMLTLYSQNFIISGGLYAIAAMISGYFGYFGRLTQTAFFILTYTVGLIITSGDSYSIKGAFDMLIASSIFMVLPQQLLSKIYVSPKSLVSNNFKASNRTSSKLKFASKTLEEIHSAVEAVSEKIKNTEIRNISAIYDKTAEEICKRCGLKMFCWESSYNRTIEAFQKLTETLKENGKVSKEDLPGSIDSQCIKKPELIRAINKYYHEFLSNKDASRKIMNAKQVATEQLEGIADMLCEISEEISESAFLNPKLSQIAYDIFSENGENPDEVYCIVDKYDRMRIEVYKNSPTEADFKLISEELSCALERDFDYPSIVTAQNMTKISFFEKAKYTLEFSAGQANCKNQNISGDCYEYFTDSRGFAHLILSDGMGNGGRAAVDSVMTCNFILKLLKAGFGFDAALKFINSALLVKAGDESLATLDIGCIDLYTGNAEFLKAGASVSFISRNKKTIIIGSSSLPIGILQGISYNKNEFKLQNNDLIVMVTDGAVSINPDWLKEEISLISELSPHEIASKITTLAKIRNKDSDDDITVLVARITAVK